MTRLIIGFWIFVLLVSICSAGFTMFDLALAMARPPTPSRAPAPLIGLGAPIVGGVLATLFLARWLRRKD